MEVEKEGKGKNRVTGGQSSNGEIRKMDSEKEPGIQQEFGNMLLLILLYCMQGVPMGLSGGSVPFLLQARASYTQIGLFSIAGYPYSSKLLWSPIVDSIYSRTFGRRKSWIVPIQLTSAILFFTFADFAEVSLKSTNLLKLTFFFFLLVFLAATQDIAVDGWALTLLSRKYVSYASTCQTIGLNIGYFLSLTVFLALEDADVCNKYFRTKPSDVGIVTLSSYLKFWGITYGLVTAAVAFLKHEQSALDENNSISLMGQWNRVSHAYSQLWAVIQLPTVRQLTLFLVTARIGFLPVESAAAFKLLEKGVAKETLAGLVVIQFPLEVVSAVLAGKWATASQPLRPWLIAYYVRLVLAMLATALVYIFPPNAALLSNHPMEFLSLGLLTVMTSFTSTLMFTAWGTFFNKISDPSIGGSYMTLLNTIANLGWMLPRVIIFILIDVLTVRKCVGPSDELVEFSCPSSRHNAIGSNACTDAGGVCEISTDGFYMVAIGMAVVGFAIGQFFARLIPKLQSKPIEAWHAKTQKRE